VMKMYLVANFRLVFWVRSCSVTFLTSFLAIRGAGIVPVRNDVNVPKEDAGAHQVYPGSETGEPERMVGVALLALDAQKSRPGVARFGRFAVEEAHELVRELGSG
jgi:hypothetical protein